MSVRTSTMASVAVPFLLVAALPGCSAESQPASYELPRGADRLIVDLSTELTSQGERVLTVEADSAFFHTGTDLVFLAGVQAHTYAATGISAVTLQADSGTLESVAQRFTALGSVTLRRSDGTVSVQTSELTFDPTTGRLRSDSMSTVEGRGRTQSGDCFETDPLLTQWSLCGGLP